MVETDADAPDPALPIGNLDTLSAQDAAGPSQLDEQLLHRDVKSRLFGKRADVRVGRYEVVDRIGRGGMGTVYLARDEELSRNVALKLLRADRASQQPRMLTEARALARLSHPNVVTVHEVGTHDDRVYVAMEYIEGRSLRQWLADEPPRAEIFDVFAQAARGLQAAHAAGLVHRDFKPDNVLLGEDGRARVVDFGVAKATDGEAEPPAVVGEDGDVTMTQTGQLLGTPAYMAPEQFAGRPVDARTDVFAFCVTLYEVLEGRRPYDGDDVQAIAHAVLTARPRPMSAPGVPRPLQSLVMRGVQPEPDARPTSLQPLIDALQAGPHPRSRRSLVLATIAATALGGLTVLGISRRPDDDRIVADEPAAAPVDPDAAAEREAFAAFLAAKDDDTRAEAATRFLERFGEDADPVRRAIAHSALGDIAWRASCPSPTDDDLCLVESPPPSAAGRCTKPLRVPDRPVERAPEAVAEARDQLQAAVALAGIDKPDDPALATAFSVAIGRARVQLADADLEHYLTRRLPQSLDFDDDGLTNETLELFLRDHMQQGSELVEAYRDVKGFDPAWVVVAAERSGRVFEGMGELLALVPIPESVERAPYCTALGERGLDRMRHMARGAYEYCVEGARKASITDHPALRRCRARAELIRAAEAESIPPG